METTKETVYTHKLDKANVPHRLAKLLMEKYAIAVIEGNLCIYDENYNYWKSIRGENYDKCIRLLIP